MLPASVLSRVRPPRGRVAEWQWEGYTYRVRSDARVALPEPHRSVPVAGLLLGGVRCTSPSVRYRLSSQSLSSFKSAAFRLRLGLAGGFSHEGQRSRSLAKPLMVLSLTHRRFGRERLREGRGGRVSSTGTLGCPGAPSPSLVGLPRSLRADSRARRAMGNGHLPSLPPVSENAAYRRKPSGRSWRRG